MKPSQKLATNKPVCLAHKISPTIGNNKQTLAPLILLSTLDSFLNISKTAYLTFIQQLLRLSICFTKNDITPIQLNAKSLKMVSQFFRKRILMTFDHVRATFLLTTNFTFLGISCKLNPMCGFLVTLVDVQSIRARFFNFFGTPFC